MSQAKAILSRFPHEIQAETSSCQQGRTSETKEKNPRTGRNKSGSKSQVGLNGDASGNNGADRGPVADELSDSENLLSPASRNGNKKLSVPQASANSKIANGADGNISSKAVSCSTNLQQDQKSEADIRIAKLERK